MMPRDVTGVLVEFARTLRFAGVDASPDRVAMMLAALDALGVAKPKDMFWAGRTTLCSTADDVAIYDAAFAAFFGGYAPVKGLPLPVSPTMPRAAIPFGSDASGLAGDGDVGGIRIGMAANDTEVLRHRDVALLSAVEHDDVRRMIAMLAVGTAPRPSRRRGPANRGDVDAARTVRRMLRDGGEPSLLLRRARRRKPRKLVLLLDVSGSMAPYADALLCFGHAAVRRRPLTTEVFTIGTRLTRVTRALRLRDADEALKAAGETIPDWHGGTRLAESLTAFLNRWGQRGTARGAIVVLCSDGWERGDPRPLGEAVARLSRLAYRLVWVNPHSGRDGYEPLTGGMAAALPYLDEFVCGHSVAALEDLVRVISHA
jgi:uncharacterized protein with von Willebrand factor type A (vWA) domain